MIKKYEELIRLCKSIATLEAIISPQWEDRYYSFNSKWAQGRSVFSMRDGSGDEFYLEFNENGWIGKVFLHELLCDEELPDEAKAIFPSFFTEPAFDINNFTFFIWKTNEMEDCESYGVLNRDVLKILDGDPEVYQSWAEEYYEKDIDLDLIKSIYEGKTLDSEIISSINPETSFDEIKKEILKEIGY